jgi:hypothetical protein
MEHNLSMGRFHRLLRDRVQPTYPPVRLSAVAFGFGALRLVQVGGCGAF